jgi:uncharacterized protein (TIGR03437 family)
MRAGVWGGKTVFALVAAATSLVAQTAQASFGAQVVQSNGTIMVPVQLSSGGLEVAAIQFDITFDTSVASLTPSADSSASSASKTVYTSEVTPSVLRVALTGQNQNSIPDGTLVSLQITPVSSGFSGTLYLSNAVASDPSGTGVTISGPGAPSPPVMLSIVNGASQQGGAVSPGEIVSLYQSGILPATVAISDVSVTFNGTAAPLLFAGANQINVITPFELAGQTTASVAVMYQGTSVGQATVSVAPTSPGVFTTGGTLQAAIVNQDGTLNSPSNPAPIGSTVSLFATGAGVFQNPALTDGEIVSGASTPTSTPVGKVAMNVDGHDVRMTYSGPAPGLVAGVLQINFVIPASLTPGSAVTLTVGVGGVQSPQVTLAVH